MLESSTKATTTKATKKSPTKSWLFKDYIKKFEITKVWSDITKKSKKAGKKTTLKNEFDNIISKIDETDELLSLKIDKGDPKIVVTKNSRRREDPGKFHGVYPGFEKYGVFRPQEYNVIQPYGAGGYDVRDPFYNRYRLNELMKQLIYDIRLRLVGWQHLRAAYRHDPLYKMGFLMSKVDEVVKNFLRMAYRSYKACTAYYYGRTSFTSISDILDAHERVLFKWFSIDLYYDLLIENDDNAREIIANFSEGRRIKWKFID